MSNYALIIDNRIDNVIICEDSIISTISGLHIKITEETGPARIGGTYNKELNKFINPQPYPSWVLDETTWKSPDGFSDRPGFWWNEESEEWVALVTTTEE